MGLPTTAIPCKQEKEPSATELRRHGPLLAEEAPVALACALMTALHPSFLRRQEREPLFMTLWDAHHSSVGTGSCWQRRPPLPLSAVPCTSRKKEPLLRALQARSFPRRQEKEPLLVTPCDPQQSSVGTAPCYQRRPTLLMSAFPCTSRT